MKYWYEAYNLISKAMIDFVGNNKSDAQTTKGEALYKALIKYTDFVESNKWIEKFKEKYELYTIDPLHIFASISANQLSFKKRQERINIILEALKIAPIKEDIDFSGCPSPVTISLLAARDSNNQKEIWDLFIQVYTKGLKGLNHTYFNQFKDWYGVEISSFTILLFWIRSDCFLPLDKNTTTFVVSTGIVDKTPKTYTGYVELLEEIQAFNPEKEPKLGSKGLFREITKIAFELIAQNKQEIIQSEDLQRLLEYKTSESGNAADKTSEISQLKKVSNNKQTSNLYDLFKIRPTSFKIIAIQPLDNCDQKLLNNLELKRIYHLNKTIEITDTIIKYLPELDIDLYDSDKKGIYIQVNAIVGENGSGKSSLIELLFRIINNITFYKRDSLKTQNINFIEGLHAQIYYMHSGSLKRVAAKGGEVKIQSYKLNDDNLFEPTGEEQNFQKSDFDSFFYSVVVNYSHYALNSKMVGNWIKELFHKNDAYQTPLVLNPMRTEGNIDINSENELVKYRLLSNLLHPVDEEDIGLRQLTTNQKAVKLSFKIIPDKNKVLYYNYYKDNKREAVTESDSLKNQHPKIYELVKEVFQFPIEHKETNHVGLEESKKYIVKKLVKISRTYSHYSGYFDDKKTEFTSMKNLKEFLQKLKTDNSHITYKLKNAINYWKYPDLWPQKKEFEVNINDASENIRKIQMQKGESNIMELLPPPIFTFDLLLEDNKEELSSFNLLSSGEKQSIYSVSSILYHLKNLDSVSENGNLVKYNSINLILDEIELYYHPEMQRKYIDYLLSMIMKIDFEYITGINICLITHSPYILSDITESYILSLINGEVAENKRKTFGANIHDLLANDFFMEDGFMGEFAKKKIKKTIAFLNISKMVREKALLIDKRSKLGDDSNEINVKIERIKKDIEEIQSILTIDVSKWSNNKPPKELVEYHKQLIDIIGEPVLKNKLESMHRDLFSDKDEKKKLLEQLAKDLGAKIKYN